jgi:hypothetical protein
LAEINEEDGGPVMAERREREAEKQWRRERENGRNEFGGVNNSKKWDPKKIESGFESGLDSKTAEGVNSNLPWDPHKIQVGI